MVRKSIIFISALLFATNVTAQDVVIAERAPKINLEQCQIPDGKLLYMSFIHSTSASCIGTTLKMMDIAKQIANLNFVILTREKLVDADEWLQHIALQSNNVIFEAYDTFKLFGIEYAPFGLLLNSEHRVLWFGNPQRLDKSNLENIVSQWSSQK